MKMRTTSSIERIDRLFDLQNYPFTALELSPSVDEEQVADVFVRINSQGSRSTRPTSSSP